MKNNPIIYLRDFIEDDVPFGKKQDKKTMKKNYYTEEILNQFTVLQREDKRWAIDLGGHNFLHWIELVDDKPTKISNPNMTMLSWAFEEEAQGIILWLKKRWSRDPNVTAEISDKISVIVNIKEEENNEIH